LPIKRLKYFTHQFLREQDFVAEQKYHLDMRRSHNRLVHGWGVVEGLTVRKKNEHEIVIEPGVAIDREGREIILESPVTRDIANFERNSHTWVTIAYGEAWEEGDRYASGGIEGYTRVTEAPVIGEKRHEPTRDGQVVTLARVRINENGHVHEVFEGNLRTLLTNKSAATGWVRLAFKPLPLEVTRFGPKLSAPKQWSNEYDFTIDHASAYCEKNARGSMQLPVPPGASRVTAWRVCGHTKGTVDVELVRGGWDPQTRKGESKNLGTHALEGDSFDRELEVAAESQPLGQWHNLSIVLSAKGETEIWLVAVHFE
jgi:hypothetical protein